MKKMSLSQTKLKKTISSNITNLKNIDKNHYCRLENTTTNHLMEKQFGFTKKHGL